MTTIQDDVVTIGSAKFRHLAKDVRSEDLDERWQKMPQRPSPSPEEMKTLRMLEERLGEAKRAKEKKHDIWNYSYLQYRSVNYYSMLYGGFPTYWNSWGMGVFIPRTFETIESIKVQVMGKVPDFSIEPTRPVKDFNFASNIQNITKSEWNRSKTQDEVAETVHDCLLYGAGIVRTDLINEKKQEYTLKWMDTEGGGKVVKYNLDTVQKYYGVGSRRIDPYDFYPNPSLEAYKRGKMGWAFERSVVDAWDFREQYRLLADAGAIGVTDNWQYIRPGGDTSDYKYLRREVDSMYTQNTDARYPGTMNDLLGRPNTGTFKTTESTKGKIEVWEYWEEDRYIVVANGLILRDSPNPYPHKRIPYVKYNLIDMNEFWSMGIPEYMRWLQVCENILYDQGLNNIIMSVHKMFAVNSRYIEDEDELVVRPFGVVHLKQIPNVKIQDAIMPIEYSHQMGNYFEFMRLNTQNIQTVTGVSPYQTGGVTTESKVERATVANRLTFAGTARIREISRHLEDHLVTGIVEDYVSIIQFYYQNKQAFPDGLPIDVSQPGKTQFVKFMPADSQSTSEIDPSDIETEGYIGVIYQDQIQGRVRVVVKGGSSMPIDPDEKARLKLDFAKFAQGAVTTEQVSTVDPATGQPTTMPVNTPVFDMKRISMEVARDVFEIDNPDEYAYKTEQPNPTAPAEETTPEAGGIESILKGNSLPTEDQTPLENI